ncbi:hypothetical protein Tco_0267260 [Tanacetum coccineum]
MMLLARAITQRYSTPTNNRLRTSSNTRNQAIVQADRVDIQSINVRNSGRGFYEPWIIREMLLIFNVITAMPKGLQIPRDGPGHYARDCPKQRVRDLKYFLEQMLLVKKYEVGIILTNEQNDFLLADAYEVEEFEDLNATACMMARIQQIVDDSDNRPI